MRKNSPELWDELWEKPLSVEEDLYALAKEQHSIRWRRIEKAILQTFGTFEGLEVIEISAGSGTCLALIAQRGARITILDYSDRALERGREFFQRHDLPAKFIHQNALSLPSELPSSAVFSESRITSTSPDCVTNKGHFWTVFSATLLYILCARKPIQK